MRGPTDAAAAPLARYCTQQTAADEPTEERAADAPHRQECHPGQARLRRGVQGPLCRRQKAQDLKGEALHDSNALDSVLKVRKVATGAGLQGRATGQGSRAIRVVLEDAETGQV